MPFEIGVMLQNMLKQFGIKVFSTMLLGMLFSVLPNIVSADTWASNRSLFAVQWVIYTFAVFAIHSIIGKSKTLLFVAVCVAGVSVSLQWYQIGLLGWSNPQIHELKIIGKNLSEKKCADNLEIVPSVWTDSLTGKVSYDEFGLPSSSQTWSAVPMVKMLCHNHYQIVQGKITILNPATGTSHANKLDLGKILHFANNREGKS